MRARRREAAAPRGKAKKFSTAPLAQPPATRGADTLGKVSIPKPELAVPLGTALSRSEPLSHLLARLKASQDRYAAVADALPPALRSQLAPGPLDDAGWTLMADHPAAAAKLRQCLPMLESTLQAQGFPPLPIKVKVRPPR